MDNCAISYQCVSVFAGINCTWEDRNMWLAPFEQNAPGKPHDNVVYAVWDEAVSISIIKLWNYSKVRPTTSSQRKRSDCMNGRVLRGRPRREASKS